MHEVLVNRLGGLSLPRKSVVGLTDRPDMTFDVYRGRKTTMQQLYLNIKELLNAYLALPLLVLLHSFLHCIRDACLMLRLQSCPAC